MRFHGLAYSALLLACAGAGSNSPQQPTSRVSIPSSRDAAESSPESKRELDLELSKPDGARILGFARDGATLLHLSGWKATGPVPPGMPSARRYSELLRASVTSPEVSETTSACRTGAVWVGVETASSDSRPRAVRYVA